MNPIGVFWHSERSEEVWYLGRLEEKSLKTPAEFILTSIFNLRLGSCCDTNRDFQEADFFFWSFDETWMLPVEKMGHSDHWYTVDDSCFQSTSSLMLF